MKTKLFVGNLSYSTGDAELRAAFEAHGRVVAAEVIMDRLTGQSRGFGFVEYGTVEDANSAQSAMHESLLDGRNIQVNVARDRGDRSERDGGPRRFGNGRDRARS
jgi:RNA recognition motif-containing protein